MKYAKILAATEYFRLTLFTGICSNRWKLNRCVIFSKKITNNKIPYNWNIIFDTHMCIMNSYLKHDNRLLFSNFLISFRHWLRVFLGSTTIIVGKSIHADLSIRYFSVYMQNNVTLDCSVLKTIVCMFILRMNLMFRISRNCRIFSVQREHCWTESISYVPIHTWNTISLWLVFR